MPCNVIAIAKSEISCVGLDCIRLVGDILLTSIKHSKLNSKEKIYYDFIGLEQSKTICCPAECIPQSQVTFKKLFTTFRFSPLLKSVSAHFISLFILFSSLLVFILILLLFFSSSSCIKIIIYLYFLSPTFKHAFIHSCICCLPS